MLVDIGDNNWAFKQASQFNSVIVHRHQSFLTYTWCISIIITNNNKETHRFNGVFSYMCRLFKHDFGNNLDVFDFVSLDTVQYCTVLGA